MSVTPPICVLHRFHSPHVAKMEQHHVWPLALGGSNVAANEIPVCPTGHRNIHQILYGYLYARGKPSWELLKHFDQNERAYAAAGIDHWLSAGGEYANVVPEEVL